MGTIELVVAYLTEVEHGLELGPGEVAVRVVAERVGGHPGVVLGGGQNKRKGAPVRSCWHA